MKNLAVIASSVAVTLFVTNVWVVYELDRMRDVANRAMDTARASSMTTRAASRATERCVVLVRAMLEHADVTDGYGQGVPLGGTFLPPEPITGLYGAGNGEAQPLPDVSDD